MSCKSDIGKYLPRVLGTSSPLECEKMLGKSVFGECPAEVSFVRLVQKGTSHKIMPPNDRFRRVSQGSQGSPARVQEKCLTEVASRMVFPEQHARGPARESYKACCEIDARRLPDQCPARSLRERERQKKCRTILLFSHRVAHYEHCFNDVSADQPGCSKHSMLARLKGEGTQSYTKHWFH